MRVCMVVFGDLAFDFRVFREACALSDAGHEVAIVTSHFGGSLPSVWKRFRIRSIPIDRGRSLRRSYPVFWRHALAAASDERAEVYHAHDLDALWPACRAATRLRAALVYDSHELFTGQSSLVNRPLVRGFWRHMEGWLISRVDRVVTVSLGIARQLAVTYRLVREPAVVRNLPPLRDPVRSERLRMSLGLSGDGLPLALYQGGFLVDNGLREVIEGMGRVHSGRLALMGSGPTESGLRCQVAMSGLQDRVRFLARVPFPDLHEHTCGADIGLCVIRPSGSSFSLSLPNKLFEYFMAGIPVLAGDTPEIRAVIEQTGAGVLVDPLDPGAIGSALESLLAEAPRREALARAARSAARRYCWEQEAPRLLEVYRSL